MRDEASALDYDLMTRTGRTLDEYLAMGAPGIGALVHFVEHLGPDSALSRADDERGRFPEPYTATLATNVLLSDIFDAVMAVNRSIYQARTKRRIKKVKPTKRPWSDNAAKRIGSKAIPMDEFDEWWDNAKGGR